MSNRSNHPVSDTDHRGDRRADDGHDGFEEDPLVELARIVSEGNAKFRPVAMTEPRFDAPAYPQADDPADGDASGWDAPEPDTAEWDEALEQPRVAQPQEQAPATPHYSDAYAQRMQPGAVLPSSDYVETQEPYDEAWPDSPQAGDWNDDTSFADAPRAPQVEWPDGPVNRSADLAGDDGQDPFYSAAGIPQDESGYEPLEPSFDAPAYHEDVRADAGFGADQERARALTADLSASLEDELLGGRAAEHDARADEAHGDYQPDEPFDDLLMDAPVRDWAEDVPVGQGAPYAETFNEDYYSGVDEAPPPPEGYDLDAVAQAMREGDPQLGGHGVLPPHSAQEQEAAPEEKSRRGLVAAAAVLGIVVVGGAVFALFDFGGSEAIGPPPVITASDEALKVYPEGGEAEQNGQSKLIYDRVGGVETPREERLVVQDESPVASLPPAPVANGGTETRVPAGPRRVRTVVVRPDGTIISGDDAAAPAAPPSAEQTASQTTPTPAASPSGQPSAPRVTTGNPTGDNTRQVTTTPVTAPGASAPVSTALSGDAAEVPQSVTPSVSGEVPTNVPRTKPGDIQTLAASAAPPPAIPGRTAGASRTSAAPLDLTGSQQGATRPAASTPASGGTIPAGAYVVQVSSQRTQDQAQAAFDNLQRRYSGVLGGVTPVIQRADLGDRGTFYRVRIPSSSRDDAISLCERLKSAGGDCFVRRN
ncbi:SPOR domain-containing protein [Stappia stellulata]|uniref:SPOR domain-containing protein n=1 Tax=Stappia stellulata TaxID=71235 RepID=UPI0004033EB4|nr:SPOR domain-containing protein [Stappia stellulata]